MAHRANDITGLEGFYRLRLWGQLPRKNTGAQQRYGGNNLLIKFQQKSNPDRRRLLNSWKNSLNSRGKVMGLDS